MSNAPIPASPEFPPLHLIEGADEQSFYSGGKTEALSRGQLLIHAKSQDPLDETMAEVLATVGLIPEDEAEQDAQSLRLAALAREAESLHLARSTDVRTYAPQELLDAREATAELNNTPLLRIVRAIHLEYPSLRNKQLELMARRLIMDELETEA